MSAREEAIAAGMTPGASMLSQLPDTWWVLPWRHGETTDSGGMLLLGGPLAGDPEVLVRVEHALPRHGGRDLTESFAWWLAELVASELCGAVRRTDLSDEEVIALNSQVHRLLGKLHAGR